MTAHLHGATAPILLAFSGGLDTSFLVPWLKETYGRPVITLTVDTGGIDDAAARVLAVREGIPFREAYRRVAGGLADDERG